MSSSAWYRQVNLRSRAWLSSDATPPAGELRPLLHSRQPDMARQVKRLGDHESGSIVCNGDGDPAINHVGRYPDASGVRMLLDIRERLRNVLEHDRRDVDGEVAVELKIDVELDARSHTERFQTLAYGVEQADGRVQRLRADVGEKAAERVFDLFEGGLDLIQLRSVWSRSISRLRDALQLQLGSRQELQGVVVEGAGEATAGLVTACGHIVEQAAPGRLGNLEPFDCHIELLFRLAVLPHKPGCHGGDSQRPDVVIRKAAPGVVCGQRADPPVARPPWDGDGVANPHQTIGAPQVI